IWPDNGETLDPWDVSGEIGEHAGTVLAGRRECDIGARDDLQQRFGGVDDLDLSVGAALGEGDGLRVRELNAFAPRGLQNAHTIEHERDDGEQGDQNESPTNAQAPFRTSELS